MKSLKHALVFAAAFSMIASQAAAISRYDVGTMSCATVQALIVTEGAVILSYKSDSVLGLSRYDRYVRTRNYCAAGEVMRGAGVPTADKKYCPVRKCVASELFTSN